MAATLKLPPVRLTVAVLLMTLTVYVRPLVDVVPLAPSVRPTLVPSIDSSSVESTTPLTDSVNPVNVCPASTVSTEVPLNATTAEPSSTNVGLFPVAFIKGASLTATRLIVLTTGMLLAGPVPPVLASITSQVIVRLVLVAVGFSELEL